jgi:hypothetical protein
VSGGPDGAGPTAAGPVQIWRERPGRRGCTPVVTAMDLAAVIADWPFGRGVFWFLKGQRSELYEVRRERAVDS